jgi:hypothetical protein
MKNFVLGLMLGLSVALGAHAWAAQVLAQGYLTGWDVMHKGERVCTTPFVWEAIREIEC